MKMKKKMITRGFIGFPIGIAIGYLITIFVSLCWGGGYYSPCVPELASALGNEIHAVVLQACLCGILGAGFGSASLIWEIEHWSIVKQTGIYFLIISAIMMPAAYFTYWMDHSIAGFLSYFGIFILIFIAIWLIQFIIGKHNVNRLNQNLYLVGRKSAGTESINHEMSEEAYKSEKNNDQ